jgi:hypothetical protein
MLNYGTLLSICLTSSKLLDVKASTYLISSPNSVHNNNAEGQSNAESTGIHLSKNWIYLVEFALKKFLRGMRLLATLYFHFGEKRELRTF